MKLPRLHRAATAAAAVAALLVPSVLLAAPAGAATTGRGYYKPPWTSTIYYANGIVDVVPITYGQWAAAGFPTPRRTTQTYYRYSWSPVIYRDTFAGPWVLQGDASLTPAEWAADGRPAPRPGPPGPASVTEWGTSDELFANPPDNTWHKLTRAEWDQLGDVKPIHRTDAGFIKLTWSDDIAYCGDLSFTGQRSAADGRPITYDEWVQSDFPTPRAAVRFPGDQFVVHTGSPTVYYSGPTMSRAITYAEWVAAGSPTPTVQ